MHDARNGQATLLVHVAHAAKRSAGHGAAVVGVVAADDGLALRLAAQVPIATHHAHDGVVRFGPRTGEERTVELRRREFGQHARQFNGGRVGALEEAVVVRQLQHLPIGRFCRFLAAIADIHAPQTSHAVEDAVAFRVPQIGPFGAHNDARAFRRQPLEVREGVEVMASVQLLPFGRGVACGQRGASGRKISRKLGRKMSTGHAFLRR